MSTGIWKRLGNVIKSYLNDDTHEIHRRDFRASGGDPDIDKAYEELDEFLNGGNDASKDSKNRETPPRPQKPVPEEIREDFAELGLTAGASLAECKTAYKKLLKIHHPDRHAADPVRQKKATEKTARVNTAYKRLETWFRTLK